MVRTYTRKVVQGTNILAVLQPYKLADDANRAYSKSERVTQYKLADDRSWFKSVFAGSGYFQKIWYVGLVVPV